MIQTASEWLAAHTGLSKGNRRSLASLAPILVEDLLACKPRTLAISGAPGSGKSTLARLLAHCLAETGLTACWLSLDDFYLGREARRARADAEHPLFLSRGVPGTHELSRLVSVLKRIRSGDADSLRLPVFDKSADDRLPPPQWREIRGTPHVAVLEGWCIGVPPAPSETLTEPVNERERTADPDGRWRRAMQRHWAEFYEALRPQLDRVWYLRVPDWQSVIEWRWQQERELSNPALQSREEVRRFLGTFQRVIEQMQSTCTEWADRVLVVDRHHEIHPDCEETPA